MNAMGIDNNNNNSVNKLNILIVGAGPSGLAFALELVQRWRIAKKTINRNMIDLAIRIRDIRIMQNDGKWFLCWQKFQLTRQQKEKLVNFT